MPQMHRASRHTARKRRPTGRASVARVAARLAAVPRAYVGLGSNLGDRESTIRSAVAELGAAQGVEVVAVSTLVDTEPVGYLDQPRFLNGVAALETEALAEGAPRPAPRRRGPLRARPCGRTGPGPENARSRPPALRKRGDRRAGAANPPPAAPRAGLRPRPLAELEPGLEVPGKGPIQTLLAGLD